MRKISFAVSFMVTLLGAVLLLISQVRLGNNYYEVVETRIFTDGQPMTFSRSFEPNIKYRFEVKGPNWTNQPSYDYRNLHVGDNTHLDSEGGGLNEPPWVYNWSDSGLTGMQTLNVTFWHYGNGQEIFRALMPTVVEISQLRETTYQLTYLMYVGLSLLVIGVIVITKIGKKMDS